MKLLYCLKFFASFDLIQSHGFQVLCFSLIVNNGGRRMPKKSRFPVTLGYVNRNRRKRPKVDASIFDSLLSHTRRSDLSEKREENSVSTYGRNRLWTSFESSPASVNSQKRCVTDRS